MIKPTILWGADFFLSGYLLFKQTVLFLGETTVALFDALCRPHKIRWRETFYYMNLCGTGALPIVLLIGFLMGLIVAFQGAMLLHQYGGDILLADMVGISICKELGALMVAMIATGRAGSSFAAEIGTMKVSEEVNAITTMGLDPYRFLVVPKVLAMLVCMPLLGIFSVQAGLLGGLAVALFKTGLPANVYWQRIVENVPPMFVVEGLTKCFVYGVIITIVGCMRGIHAEDNAQGVGLAATSTVVQSIILITIANALLTYFFIVLG